MTKQQAKPASKQAPKTRESFSDAVKTMDISAEDVDRVVDDITNDFVEGQTAFTPGTKDEETTEQVHFDGTNPDPNAIPDWVRLPDDFQLPAVPDICFIRFRAKWTRSPQLGDRAIVLWPLSFAEERLATNRAQGNSSLIVTYQALQCVRLIDGMRADWTGKPSPGRAYSVMKFVDEIGKKCRHMIENYYGKTHMLDNDELVDFFVNCFALRTGM